MWVRFGCESTKKEQVNSLKKENATALNNSFRLGNYSLNGTFHNFDFIICVN